MKTQRLMELNPSQDLADLQLYDDLYKGGAQFKERIEKYLLKRAFESAEHYQLRRDRSFYIPYASALIDYFAANLFVGKTIVKLEDGSDPPEDWQEFLSNVDGRGKDWDFFWRKVFTRAQIDKWAFVSVTFPAREGAEPANASDEAPLMRPYLTSIKRRCVRDWEKDSIGRPHWVIIQHERQERADPEKEREKCDAATKRWILIKPNEVCMYARPTGAAATPPPDEDAVEASRWAVNAMPLVELKVPHGMWIMGTTSTIHLALFRKWNDLAWSLQMGAYPMPVIYKKGAFMQTMGEGYFLQFEDRQKEGAEMLEPSGTAYAALSQDVANLKDELHRVTHQMAMAVSNTAISSGRSGESKKRDHLPTIMLLKAFGQIVREKMEETLNMIAILKGEKFKFSVSGLDEFDVEDLQTWLTNVTLAQTLGIKSPTFQRLIQQNAALKILASEADATKALVRQEIEAAGEMEGKEGEEKKEDEDKEEGEVEGKDDRPESDYDAKQLALGTRVEMEHTDDPAVARRIAKDHLDERPDYYAMLVKVEKKPAAPIDRRGSVVE